ncbi:UDP-glucose 4-epimerase [Melghirimyces profundicolus]|uniref:UDP-glucose 4-epimerase n=1 Tax=Melghirimyces profundicolus TaxID=1242148 RepID=A0A2T6BW95_9BACL|nr:NAD(P)-dependent oxidoreductase [Melghirimyces profundicolus]PTX60333.1 UDP-glucose 4-epimerase [Melghirimyces profundicolus]
MILITGATGYIGSSLTGFFVSRGVPVRAVDDFSVGGIRSIKGVEVLRKDVTEVEDVREMVEGVSVVIHLAAISDVSRCQLHRKEALLTNVLSLKYLIDEGKKAGVSKFIFPSSFTVYGAGGGNIHEELPVEPFNFYGQMKVWCEELLLSEQQKGHLDTVIFRQSNVCGSGEQPKSTVVETFCGSAVRREPIVIHGSGNQVRNFVHIRDLLEAYYRAAMEKVSGVINGAGHGSVSIRQIADWVNEECRQRLGHQVPIIHRHQTVVGHERETESLDCEPRRLIRLLGSRPLLTVRDAIREYFSAEEKENYST